jgi:hypothetical protein
MKSPGIFPAGQAGHANPSVTLMIYAHSTVDMQTDIANIMDAIVTPVAVELPVKESIPIGPGG